MSPLPSVSIKLGAAPVSKFDFPRSALEVPGAPKVWEIKVPAGPGWRLYVVREQATWVATHGNAKPPNKKVSGEVRRARNIFKNWTNDE